MGAPNQTVVRRTGSNAETSHRDNLAAVIREAHLRGPVSRSDLGSRTGLSRSAVKVLVSELEVLGLVYERMPAPSGTPGRPSPLVHANPFGAAVLAIDIAVDSMSVAVVGLGGRVHARARLDRARGRFSPEETITDILELSQRVLAEAPARTRLFAVGVAVVGAVRASDGLVPLAPNLGWHDVPLGERLGERLGLGVPAVVGNEADLGALAEHTRGAGTGIDDLIYLSGDVGLGAGIITNGRALVGAAGFAGEIGHMVIGIGRRACGCGNIGCWETEVGEGALLTLAGRVDPDGTRDAVDRLFDDADAGDPGVLSALTLVGERLGVGLAGLVNIFNPRLVVLGGLFGRMEPYVGEMLRREIAARSLPMVRDIVRIAPSALGADATLLGAAELAFEPLLLDPLQLAESSAA